MSKTENEKDDRTQAERRCCHMGQWGLGDGGSLGDWRKEFRSIPASEHCRDCPLISR